MLKQFAERLRTYLLAPLRDKDHRTSHDAVTAAEQKSLALLYREQFRLKRDPISFDDAGFRVHSQHEEDGILLYIFALIGTTNKRCVELCAGTGIECNTANLILNHGWKGLLFDGNDRNVAKARDFFGNHPDTRHWPPVIRQEWITRDKINSLISDSGFSGEIDLFSLDIDGVDYWLWQAIDCISPRVVVLEVNHLWGPNEAVTVPYKDDFVAEFSQYGSDYAGASLAAFVKLGKEKGYRLVGTNRFVSNAFFVRNDIACDWLPEVDPTSCFGHPRAEFGMKERLPKIRDKEWVKV